MERGARSEKLGRTWFGTFDLAGLKCFGFARGAGARARRTISASMTMMRSRYPNRQRFNCHTCRTTTPRGSPGTCAYRPEADLMTIDWASFLSLQMGRYSMVKSGRKIPAVEAGTRARLRAKDSIG